MNQHAMYLYVEGDFHPDTHLGTHNKHRPKFTIKIGE